MISDVVCECIVKKEIETRDWLRASGLSLLSLIGAGVISTLAMTYLEVIGMSISLLALIGAVCLIVRIYQELNVEYEYTFVNGDLTIDKIINMSRRKRVLSFDAKDVESAGVYDAKTFNKSKYNTCCFCASSQRCDNAIFLAYRNKADNKNTCVIVECSDKLIENLRKYVTPAVYREGLMKR